MASNECPMDDILFPYNVAPRTGFHSIFDALHNLRKPPHLLFGKCSLWEKGVIMQKKKIGVEAKCRLGLL